MNNKSFDLTPRELDIIADCVLSRMETSMQELQEDKKEYEIADQVNHAGYLEEYAALYRKIKIAQLPVPTEGEEEQHEAQD